MMDDADRRRDEAEVLASMFPDIFIEVSSSEWMFHRSGAASEGEIATLSIRLPSDYPSCSPPDVALDAPGRAGLREACQDVLRDFSPGSEFGNVLAQWFCDFCDNPAPNQETAAPERSDPETLLEAGALSAVVELKPDITSEIRLSLVAAGFQSVGPQVFIHGELGVAVEIREELHVSVDGIDTDLVSSWVTDQLNDEVSCFGERLLKWADNQRASGESNYGSADGIIEKIHKPDAGGITLTGNAAWKARLQAGETVEFRGGGNSLHPRIKSGECCKYEPVFKHDDIKVKDIVFCQIKGRFWGHMVKKKTFVGGRDEYEYTISNIHGWENGTCALEHIYGKVVDHWK